MRVYTLRENPSKDDEEWKFTVPPDALVLPQRNRGKLITFSAQAITLKIEQFPTNRILHADEPAKFILASFGSLRFPESNLRTTAEYITRLLKAGLFLNGAQYRFYHHSNSQLRGRSCFLREANSDAELDAMIYQFGDFGNIMNIAKRAKRIGLLFSAAQIDYLLHPSLVGDIPDIKTGDELFSDGCGLISRKLAVQVSKAKQIIFRGSRYTPTVFQIRYEGYKGVLMLHPQLDVEKKHLAEFRKSMKKFTAMTDHTLSVVDHSKPYAFGRLNNDIIVLLSSLGITNEKLLAKQETYFQWVVNASIDPVKAVDFLSCLGQYPLAEKVLLDGLEEPNVARNIRRLQLSELASFRNDREKYRSRMMIHSSRRLFGVCDPFKVLKEGEVHIRITTARKGPSTPIHGDVIVVKNPCLHPGDCLKLRAVQNDKLAHLVDCIVFASVARPGHRAAPSMSSGGDLDGDDFFVCWDKDIVPSRVFESYDYPGAKEHVGNKVTRNDLANHFATYSASSVARVSDLHSKWARSSPNGALCVECQELNALHSQSVDGARIKIPDRLTRPPESNEPYVLDILEQEALKFSSRLTQSNALKTDIPSIDPEEGKTLVLQLLKSKQNAISEYELFTLALNLARKHTLDMRLFLNHIDMSALSTQEKYALSSTLDLSSSSYPYVWNSLFRSDILTPQDLYQRSLDRPFSLQRLYSSRESGLRTFFEYLRIATQEYTRKFMILQIDARFSIGIFMRGSIPWDEEPEVNENVVVCSFMPQSSATVATQRPCTPGYRLHCTDTILELYNKHRGDTFIFLQRPPATSGADIAISVALQKISDTVRRQLGRVNRTAVTAIELHVVSNHDRVAHQLFDLWFEHVPTEIYTPRFQRQAVPYRMNDLRDVDWSEHPDWLRRAFYPPISGTSFSNQGRLAKHTEETMKMHLADQMIPQVDSIMKFGVEYHADEEIFMVFTFVISGTPFAQARTIQWLEAHPPLVFALLKTFPPDDSFALPPEISHLAHSIARNVIRSANEVKIAALVALEKIAYDIAQLSLEQYFDLLILAALSVRSQQLVQEVLLVLNDCRLNFILDASEQLIYGHNRALGIAFDRAEEAADECPCNEDGKPRRQRTSPAHTKLTFVPEKLNQVIAAVRVDAKTAVRLHSHVRLQATSKAENRWIDAPVLDGLVIQSMKGEFKIELLQPPPPEMEKMDWNLYNAGSIATSKAMMDALLRLLEEKSACCRFYNIIIGDRGDGDSLDEDDIDISQHISRVRTTTNGLNDSQLKAVESWRSPLSLIWGPPGTGKTTVVVQILKNIIDTYKVNLPKILMTASTHNAVDNVLERFIEINKDGGLLEEQILRVATDQSKVNQALKNYTIDARLGGDMNENNRLVKQAQERVKGANIIFTTCAGAGLGILRKVDFDIAIIDEASQITEPCALIPLVKGVKRAIMVGDHVQLRPTVRRMAKALEFDVSLLERLYIHAETPIKTMLDVQYRSPQQLNAFPAKEFYENRLKTSPDISGDSLKILSSSKFPWPERDGVAIPTIFIQCSDEEEMGGLSKSNLGQAGLVAHILPLITTTNSDGEIAPDLAALKIAVLSPYTKQIQELRHRVPSSVTCSTIDSFQGRESDIVIFSAVRCNAEGDVGFLDDPRRLNVMWTRARLALIIIGDRKTMNTNPLWRRALNSCSEVNLQNL